MQPDLEQFLISMALCHTVQTLEELSGNDTPLDNKAPQYQASSPDEKALVEAAARYAFGQQISQYHFLET